MPRPTRLAAAKKDIFALFDNSAQRAYSPAELTEILRERRGSWHLAERTTASAFIAFLEDEGMLKAKTFHAVNYDRQSTRYVRREASIYELAQSLRPQGYLSHSTAAVLHGLTNLSVKTLYLNVEQSPKPVSTGSLTQRGIEQAFARQQRYSKMTFDNDGYVVTVINGKNTSDLGVEQLLGPSNERLRVTNLERTLIDIVVRPTYAGGISQVLEVYRAARSRVSTDLLLATLKKLNYVYPFHQAIGFLMERAGYTEEIYAKLRELGLNFDFYLTHKMLQPAYSSHWRLFHPKELEV